MVPEVLAREGFTSSICQLRGLSGLSKDRAQVTERNSAVDEQEYGASFKRSACNAEAVVIASHHG